jgi:hypothetical protein
VPVLVVPREGHKATAPRRKDGGLFFAREVLFCREAGGGAPSDGDGIVKYSNSPTACLPLSQRQATPCIEFPVILASEQLCPYILSELDSSY